MTKNSRSIERDRIRAARYAPPGGFEEALFMTLRHLPKRKVRTLKQKIAMASTIAAAIALFAVFAAPPIVRAVGQLYTRLFGDVIADIEAEQAKPDDQKFDELLAEYEDSGGWHTLSGASQMLGGAEISVDNIGLSPVDYEDRANNPKGRLSIALAYDKIPSFDPNYVDFVINVDGKDIPQPMDENLKMYREAKHETLTEAQWEGGSWSSNSYMQPFGPRTYLSFPVDNWKWEKRTPLVLKATIDGQQLEIAFEFSPEKAHEQAVADAELSVKLAGENYEHEKDELQAMAANAVPVGLSGSAFGHDYQISEMSFADGMLYLNVAFGNVETEYLTVPKDHYWASVQSVDGMSACMGGASESKVVDGVYTAVIFGALGRDPGNLPEESLITIRLEVEKYENTKDLAFRYNWNAKRVALPRDDAEMQAWVDEAHRREAEHQARFGVPIGYDLTPLNLTQQADGVSFTITGARYAISTKRIKFDVKIEGDVKNSKYLWYGAPEVTINGLTAYDDGASLDARDVYTALNVAPPLDISEFGNGERVVFDFPLYDKNSGFDNTNYPPVAETLKFEFSIDKDSLPALQLDEYGFVIE